MPESAGNSLDRLGDALGATQSEVLTWIEERCRAEFSVSTDDVASDSGSESPGQRIDRPYEYSVVFHVVESIVLGETAKTLGDLRAESRIQEPYFASLVARVLAWQFDLDASVVAQGVEMLKLVVEAPTVGASRRTSDGRIVFRNETEKQKAIALFRAFKSSASNIRGRLVAILGPGDEDSGIPDSLPMLVGHPWLEAVPRDAWEPLLRLVFDEEFDSLLEAVENARVGSRDEHKQNAAVIVRLIWEHSGRQAKTHHGRSPTDYMRFASTVGRLFDLKLGVTLLESTRSITSLPGVQKISFNISEM